MPFLTESKNEKLAKNANKYSREQILEGSTQLANNGYDVNKRLVSCHNRRVTQPDAE